MDNKQYLIESAKTDSDKNYNFTDDVKQRLIVILEQYLETMKALDAIKREIFYDDDAPFAQTMTPRGYTHGIIGIATESQELCETFLDHLKNGTHLDTVNLREECGDVLWYVACVLREAGSNFEESMGGNIEKLRTRFPELFKGSIAMGDRDKEKEMIAMQKGESLK